MTSRIIELPLKRVLEQSLTVTILGETPQAGQMTLRQAVEGLVANEQNTIQFQNGLTGTINLTRSLEIVDRNVDILGPGADRITISGDPNAAQPFRIFQISSQAGNNSVSISNLKIEDGRTAEGQNGAGILATGLQSFQVNACVFLNNISSRRGGAIEVFRVNSFRVHDTYFGGNETISGNGGAILLNFTPSVTITNCRFSGNQAGGSDGALAGCGGAIMVSSGVRDLSILVSTFDGNMAENLGGAICFFAYRLDPATRLDLRSTTFDGNQANSGGAIYFGGPVNGVVRNSTFANNIVSSEGGAIWNFGELLTIVSSTFANNDANRGGGIYEENQNARISMGNTIVAGNSAATAPDYFGPVSSLSVNLIGMTDDSTGWVQADITGTSTSPVDPLLNDIGLYRGSTVKTMTLQANSPAINAGHDDLTPGPADQRGFTRIVGSDIDIGAVEMQTGETGLAAPFANNVDFSVMLGQTLSLPAYEEGETLLDYSGNDPLEVEITAVNGSGGNVGEEIETTNGGLLTLNEDGTFVYLAPDDYVGDDSFTYTISDGVTNRTGTVTIHVVNTIAYDASFSVLRDEMLTITAGNGLLLSAFAASGDAITVTEVNGDDANLSEPTATTEGGSVTVEADGSFVYTPDTSFEGDDTFTFTISDGISTSTATVTIHVVKVLAEDAPFDLDEDDTLTVPENEGLLTFAEDADSDPLTVVAINGDEGAVSEEIETAMGGTLTVEADGSFVYEPAADFYGEDWFTYTVSDGTETSTAVAVITVDAVNDDPEITAPGMQNLNEDTPLVFSTGNGNAISIDDIDAGSATVQCELVSTNGVLTLSTTTGLSFSFSDSNGTGAGDGTSDSTMRFRGTLAAINAALGGLTYTPAANYHGSAWMTVTVNDLGNTGTGGAGVWTQILFNAVASVNDAPTGTNNTVYTSQNTDYVFGTSDFGFADAIDGDAFEAVKITSLATSGTLYWYNGSAWVAVTLNQFISAADIAAGKLKYTPPSSTTGDFTFNCRVQDDGGTVNGGIDLDLTDRTMTVNVS